MTQARETDTTSYEVTVDGTVVAKGPRIEEVLRIALDRKQNLPQQIVSVHDTFFCRTWTIDQFGRVTAAGSEAAGGI